MLSPMTNQEIARILYEMAALWDMLGVEFKPRSYEKAAQGVEGFGDSLMEAYKKNGIKGLLDVPGVGKGIAGHIEELLKTGHYKEYEQLKKKIPVDITSLMRVQGLGPKNIKTLWEKLEIRTLEDLERAAKAQKIRALRQFGQKSEERILSGIEFLKRSGGRQLLGALLPEIRDLEKAIAGFPEVERAAFAGSARRRRETVGDIDLLAVSSKPEAVVDRFLALPAIDHVYGKGPTKINVLLKNGVDADLRIIPAKSFGSALCYFTGSKDHNIKLREIAIKKGYKLNEYGLFKGKKFIAGRTEDELYRALGLSYVEPELRESTGEIEAAREGRLPDLVNYGDLKGDLQVQTDWTDGENTIEAMADAAEAYGLEYIAITDHTQSLAMTGGSDEAKLLKQMAAIDKINAKLRKQKRKFRILKGAEVNIQKDGSLDIADEVLAKLDVVGVAVHSHFTLTREEQTLRVLRAIENPNADIFFHPSARSINRREPIAIDMEEVIRTAKRTGTILEIDSLPDRLDLKDEYIRECVELEVKMCIDSDAHSVSHFQYLELGIGQARRGWATKKDIVNTLSVDEFLRSLKNPPQKRRG